MIIPGTARDIILILINEYGYTNKEIAKKINVDTKTIRRISNHSVPSGETDLRLMMLYIRTKTVTTHIKNANKAALPTNPKEVPLVFQLNA